MQVTTQLSVFLENRAGVLARLAADLVRLKVDVIFAGTTPAALAARDATNAIPIVFATVADPIGVKLVSSLPRPGGNVTGLTTNNTEVAGKRLEIFKEMLGGKVSRLAMLFNPADASNVLALQTVEDSARKLKVTLRPFPAKGPEDFAGAFSAMASERIDAVLVAAGVLTLAHARDVAELATGLGCLRCTEHGNSWRPADTTRNAGGMREIGSGCAASTLPIRYFGSAKATGGSGAGCSIGRRCRSGGRCT